MSNFWSDPKRAKEMMQELTSLKSDTAALGRMMSDSAALQEMLPLAEGDEGTAREIGVKAEILEKKIKQKKNK